MRDVDRTPRGGPWQALLAGAAAAARGAAAPAALAQQQGGSLGPGLGQDAGTRVQQVQAPGIQAAPSQAPGQQAGSPLPAVVGQLRTAEQALRQAEAQLTGRVGAPEPNFAMARTAVSSGLNVLPRVPEEAKAHDTFRTALRELNDALQALPGGAHAAGGPDPRQAAPRLREAADAVGALAGRVGAMAAGGAAPGAGHQQRVEAQPAQPQGTIVQPQPVQPQVIMRRPGAEPQGEAEPRTGATAITPAPVQSGGTQAQPAVAAPAAAGMALEAVQSLVGRNVVGAGGREAGEVRNLLIDGQGRVRAAVVEWGGFLGLGERQALVPIERIQPGQGAGERARLAMTREELEALPRYDRDRLGEYGRERGWGEGLRLFR